jgi:fructokinase
VRLGVDLGGTKTEIIALDDGNRELLRRRIASPRGDYRATVEAIAGLVTAAEAEIGAKGSVGVAIPGTLDGAKGREPVKNANSTWLNGQPLARDLGAVLAREIRLANDANCFALSEATDGAAAGLGIVFGVIVGTGVGGGVVVQGRALVGAHGIAGEWGHNPLPGMSALELAEAPQCYCGQRGCIETWVSGPALAADFARHSGRTLKAAEIAASSDQAARAAMARFTDRFARALASVVNILDPDAIVLGGGLSNIESLYRDLPPLVESYAFTPGGPPNILKNKHGDSSGVRGAAWLWPPGS